MLSQILALYDQLYAPHPTRADLLHQFGRDTQANTAYQRAAERQAEAQAVATLADRLLAGVRGDAVASARLQRPSASIDHARCVTTDEPQPLSSNAASSSVLSSVDSVNEVRPLTRVHCDSAAVDVRTSTSKTQSLASNERSVTECSLFDLKYLLREELFDPGHLRCPDRGVST